MRRLFLLIGGGLGPWLALAATPIPTSATFPVNATVQSGCFVVGNPTQSSGVNFGMLDFGTQPAISTTPISTALSANGGSMALVQCTPGSAVTVTLDGGVNAVGPQRRLKMGSGNYLPYTLYTSSNKAVTLQPGVGVAVDTNSGAINLPVFGVATPPVGGLPAGQYTDTVQVTFSW